VTAYASEANDPYGPSKAPGGHRDRAVAGAVRGYRVDVAALTVDELVRLAGGWLFDRVSMGWTVNVSITEPCDVRPLRILGVPPVSADANADSTTDVVHALAMAAELLKTDVRARENIVVALDRGNTEMTLWGDVLPDMLGQHAKTEHHRLSNAARVFKAQALRAASLPHERVSPT
jgi:hypothetical protein